MIVARCGCSGASCSCVVKGSGGVSVTGSGSAANPYLVASSLNLNVVDTATVDLTLAGDGSVANPFLLSAAALLSLDELVDVNTAGGVTGYVLARQSNGTYQLVPPATASAGTLAVGNGLLGDGSSGSPLAVKLAASSGLTLTASGLAVSGTGAWTPYTPVLTATTTNPTLGNGSLGGRYAQMGKLVFFGTWLTWGSTSTRGSGYLQISLPVAALSTNVPVKTDVRNSATTEFVSQGRLNGSKVYPILIQASGSDTDMTWVSNTNPATWAAGSSIVVSGVYEAA